MTPADLSQFDVVDSLPAECPEAWDALVGRHGVDCYSSRAWHLAMGGNSGAEERVAWTRRRDGSRDASGSLLALVAVFRYAAGPGNALLHPGMLLGGASAAGEAEARRWEPVTLVGNASGYVTAPVVEGDLAPWVAAIRQAGRVGDRQARGTALVPYLTDAAAARLRPFLPDVPFLLAPMRVVLPLAGGSLDEYYAALTPRQRELARRERRSLAKGGRVMTAEALSPDNIVELGRLQELTQRRHEAFGDARYFEEIMQRMRAGLASSVFAFVCRHEGRALGYLSCLRHRNALVARSAGLDYERVGSHAEYFNLLIHAPVEYALAHGLQEIDLGIEGYFQKLVRGGRPMLQWHVLLRPPPHWSAEDSQRHNRTQAQAMAQELKAGACEAVAERLARIASTGLPDFS
jgi:Peptidogalycan biosysnthesis/recognition